MQRCRREKVEWRFWDDVIEASGIGDQDTSKDPKAGSMFKWGHEPLTDDHRGKVLASGPRVFYTIYTKNACFSFLGVSASFTKPI